MKPILYAQILILFQETEWNICFLHKWCITCSENIWFLLLIVVCFCYLLYIQNTHDSYQIYQLSSIGKCNFFGTILLTMSHNYTVPNQVVNATAGASTVDSVSATWNSPEGTINGYEITCSSGSPSPSNGNDTLTGASCTNLPTAGEEYNMTIISISNGLKNNHTISLRACKKCLAFIFSFVPALKINTWQAIHV